MEKKTYKQPELLIVNVKAGSALLAGSTVQSVDAPGTDLKYVDGGSDEAARGRSGRGWLDDEE